MPLISSKEGNIRLQAKDLWFSYGQDSILRGVSLKINQGEFVGIAGPNGSGKTTLMKILVGILPPQRGSVKFYSDKCKPGEKCIPYIGYVPQEPLLREQAFPVTVREVVQMGRYGHAGLLRRLSHDDETAVDSAIEEAGLKRVEEEMFGDLSGGQQQRVLTARALVGNPDLLALDEPTSGVDAKGKQDFYKLLEHLHSKHEITVLVIMHDLPDLMTHVERVVFLQRKVIYDGPSAKLGSDGLWKLMVKASKLY